MTIVGARPQLIKCSALTPYLANHFKQIIVHTGQHHQKELSGSLIHELGMPEPNYQLNISGGSGLSQIGKILLNLEPIIIEEKPDLILVFGDTNTTAAGAISAAKFNIRLAHVEAGMREFDKSIPEESNKLITSALSDFHFCPTPSAVAWLHNMGIKNHVYLCGDVMLDLIDERIDSIENNHQILNRLNITPKKFVFVTVHRAANTDNINNLKQIIDALNEISKPIIFPIHPRTLAALQKGNLMPFKKHILVTDPLGWLDTQTLIRNAAFVITDSGGVTKEAFHHKTQGILVDKQTEWVETVEQGWNIQAGPNKIRIIEAINSLERPNFHEKYNSNGRAGNAIIGVLKKLLIE